MKNDRDEHEIVQIQRSLRPNWPLICILVAVAAAWILTAIEAYHAAGEVIPPF